MSRILVTGMSRTGKSSALAELARRGFRTVDTDEPGWTVEDTDGGRWWDEEPIAQLLADEGPALYVSGTVTNQGWFYDRFDAIVLLSAPAEVLLERISARETLPALPSDSHSLKLLSFLRYSGKHRQRSIGWLRFPN